MANQMRNYIQLITALHQHRGMAFKQNFVPSIMKAIDLIKAIAVTLDRKQETVALSLSSIMKIFLNDTQKALGSIKERATKSKPDIRSDVHSAYLMINELSRGTLNSPRMDLLKLCTDFLDIKNLLKDNERSTISDGMWKLELMVDFQNNLAKATDCSFVYWIQELNSHFFQFIYKNPQNVHRLKYLFMALEDVVDHLT